MNIDRTYIILIDNNNNIEDSINKSYNPKNNDVCIYIK